MVLWYYGTVVPCELPTCSPHFSAKQPFKHWTCNGGQTVKDWTCAKTRWKLLKAAESNCWTVKTSGAEPQSVAADEWQEIHPTKVEITQEEGREEEEECLCRRGVKRNSVAIIIAISQLSPFDFAKKHWYIILTERLLWMDIGWSWRWSLQCHCWCRSSCHFASSLFDLLAPRPSFHLCHPFRLHVFPNPTFHCIHSKRQWRKVASDVWWK